MKILPILIASLTLSTAVQAAETLSADRDLPAPPRVSTAAVCGNGISRVATADDARPGLCPRPLGTTLIARQRHVARV